MAVFFQSFARHFSMYNLTAALGLCAALVFSLRRLSANGFDGAVEKGRMLLIPVE